MYAKCPELRDKQESTRSEEPDLLEGRGVLVGQDLSISGYGEVKVINAMLHK